MKTSNEIEKSGKEVMREAISENGITQKELAEKIGMSQSSLTQGLAREHISLEMFCRIIDGLGYAVAVVDKQKGHVRWIVEENK